MAVNKKQRKNFALRLQPYEGTVLSEVVDYLNSLDRDEANRKIAEILTISLLPLARYEQNFPEKTLRFSTLESCHALSQYAHFLRQTVGITVEIPLNNDFLMPPVASPAKKIKEKAEREPTEKPQHPKSEFGTVEGLDELFG
jgi:hypothetical protein